MLGYLSDIPNLPEGIQFHTAALQKAHFTSFPGHSEMASQHSSAIRPGMSTWAQALLILTNTVLLQRHQQW